tara:strand:+ start:11391 stop:12296 length:906 start_codon:yes stop_codon:yes gene_type:complete
MKKLLSLTTLLVIMATSTHAQIKLSYNLDENTIYNSKVTIDQTIAQTMMGQTQNIQNDQGYGVTITVEKKNTDSYSLSMMYNSIMINSPKAGLTYDSETATSEPTGPAKALSSVIGTEFSFELNKDGSVSSVSGIQAMLDSMAANMGLADEAQASAFKAQISAQYNEEAVKSQMKRTLVIYPDKELNKGDTWSADESVTTPFTMNIQTTYELADFDDKTATINVSSNIFSEEGSITMGGATMTPDLSGVQSGTIVVDKKTGLVLSANMEQLVSGVMNMTSPQEMEIPIEISGTSTIEGSIK